MSGPSKAEIAYQAVSKGKAHTLKVYLSVWAPVGFVLTAALTYFRSPEPMHGTYLFSWLLVSFAVCEFVGLVAGLLSWRRHLRLAKDWNP